MITLLLLLGAVEWMETTAEDFLSNLGHDPMMYISQRANLEAIPGCVEFFARFDVDNNGYYDVLASDGRPGYLRLYKGSSSGFHANDSIYYPIPSEGGGCDLADLSLDGYAELIHSGYNARRVTIYWNDGINGPDPHDSTTLHCPNDGSPETVYIYDLDKDTYLDIIAADAGTDQLIVFWGFPTGDPSRPVAYSDVAPYVSNFTQGGGEHNIELGDINKDGWGDIVAGADNGSQYLHLYWWGPASAGREPDHVTDLLGAGGSNHGVSMADLNNDEWLDLVFTLSYAGGGQNAIVYFYDPETESYPASSSVLLTPGSCYGGSAIWDWADKKGVPGPDGLLDIIFFRSDPGNRQPPVVYYNQGEEPYFWESDSTMDNLGDADIVCSGGFMADFNYDGFWDIYLNAYRGHSASYILYGPDYLMAECDSVPVNEDHHGVFREPGNIYNRTYTAWYDSDVFDCGKYYNKAKNCKITYIANKPGASDIDFYLRSGPDSIPTSSGWTDWDKCTNGYGDPDALRWRYVQYRAEFRYPKPVDLPWLEQVKLLFYLIDFDLKLWPDSLKATPASDYVDYFTKLFYLGDERDSFHMTLRAVHNPDWHIELWDTAYVDTIPWYIKLDAIQPQGDDTAFYVRVYVPEDAQVGDSNVTVIYTKTRRCSQDMQDSVILITKVAAGGVYEGRIERPAALSANSIDDLGIVNFTLPAGERAHLVIYDPTGRRVYAREVEGSGSVQWSDAATPAGLYFVRLERTQGIISRKVILTH